MDALRTEHKTILKSLILDGPATVSEVSDRTGMFLKTASNRLTELKGFGLVVDTAKKRINPRGRMETVVEF